jgi:hypothetical protein
MCYHCCCYTKTDGGIVCCKCGEVFYAWIYTRTEADMPYWLEKEKVKIKKSG